MNLYRSWRTDGGKAKKKWNRGERFDRNYFMSATLSLSVYIYYCHHPFQGKAVNERRSRKGGQGNVADNNLRGLPIQSLNPPGTMNGEIYTSANNNPNFFAPRLNPLIPLASRPGSKADDLFLWLWRSSKKKRKTAVCPFSFLIEIRSQFRFLRLLGSPAKKAKKAKKGKKGKNEGWAIGQGVLSPLKQTGLHKQRL